MKGLMYLFGAGGLLVLTAVCVRADVLTYSVTPSGGQFAYEFTLANSGATGGTLFDLFLSLPTDITNIDTTSIGTPVGWGDVTGGLLFFGLNINPSTAFIQWAADVSGSYDVGIGNSLSGFSFVSSQSTIAPVMYALNSAGTFSLAQQTSAVPEPTNVVLLASVLGCMLFVRAKRKRVVQ